MSERASVDDGFVDDVLRRVEDATLPSLLLVIELLVPPLLLSILVYTNAHGEIGSITVLEDQDGPR